MIKETLADLVRIDSVSSRSNADIVEYLEKRCQKLRMMVGYVPYIDKNLVQKFNLIACSHRTDKVELALVGHTDTVPYDPNWSEATNLTERDGKLYGRGSCDTKGFIAAALTALETAKPQKPVALVCTADEEIGLVGAKVMAENQALCARYSIVGEPTSLKPIRAGKGYSLAEVIVKGREAHSAYPALGASAVFRAARLINRLESIATKLKEDQHPAFDPPYTTLNIGLIHGGSAKNVLAGECRFSFESAIGMRGDDAEYKSWLAWTRVLSGDVANGIKALMATMREHPQSMRPLFFLGLHAAQTGEPDKARTLLQECTRRSPHDVEVQAALDALD